MNDTGLCSDRSVVLCSVHVQQRENRFLFGCECAVCCSPVLLRNRVRGAAVLRAVKITLLDPPRCVVHAARWVGGPLAALALLSLKFVLHLAIDTMQMFTSRHAGSSRACVMRPVRHNHVSTQPLSLLSLR